MSDTPPMIRLAVDGQWVSGVGRVTMTHRPHREYVNILAEVMPQPPRPPLELDADELADAIVAHIKAQPDSFVAAGQWITAITNAATQAIREEDRP